MKKTVLLLSFILCNSMCHASPLEAKTQKEVLNTLFAREQIDLESYTIISQEDTIYYLSKADEKDVQSYLADLTYDKYQHVSFNKNQFNSILHKKTIQELIEYNVLMAKMLN